LCPASGGPPRRKRSRDVSGRYRDDGEGGDEDRGPLGREPYLRTQEQSPLRDRHDVYGRWSPEASGMRPATLNSYLRASAYVSGGPALSSHHDRRSEPRTVETTATFVEERTAGTGP
jgi:hypothetical protein